MAWLGGSSKTVKWIDSSNGSKKTVATATAAAQTGLGGDKMTATEEAQSWLVIRRRQHQDKSNCGRNGGGAKLA